MRLKNGSGGGRAEAQLTLLRKAPFLAARGSLVRFGGGRALSSFLSKISLFLFLLLFGPLSTAAELPHVYALVNARVVTSPGKALEKATVVVRGGVVEAVGVAGAVAVPADAQVIDLSGRTVSPGLIDPYVTESRLSGVRAVAADGDARGRRAVGAPAVPSPTPAPEPAGNAHPIARVHPERSVLSDLRIAPDVREAFRDLGFTTVAAVPDKGIFRGESAVVSLGDVSLGKSIVVAKSAQHVARDADAPGFGGEYPASKMGAVAAIRQTFSDARWLAAAEAAFAAKPAGRARPERLDAWVALADAAAGKEAVVFETPDVLSLLRASKIAAEFALKARYVGAADAYLLADEVQAAKPQLVLTLAFPLPTSVEDDDDWGDVSLQRLRAWDRAPSNPKWMRDLGLTFALTTHGLAEIADLADRAKKARARGLSADDLLASFTTVPAKMLGLEGRAGEIVAGAAANLVVSTGPLFADRTIVEATWVDGVPYEVKPKKVAVTGVYRVDGTRVDVRNDPRTGHLTVSASAAGGGRPAAATQVARHGQRLEFDIEGAAFGLPGPQRVAATVEGDVLKLELVPASGGPAVAKVAERDRAARSAARMPGGAPGGERGGEATESAAAAGAAETHEAPDSDVRPLPARFAHPLLAPKAVLVKNATVWTSGPEGTLPDANLLIVDGKVAAVGKGVTVPAALAASCRRDRRRGPRGHPGAHRLPQPHGDRRRRQRGHAQRLGGGADRRRHRPLRPVDLSRARGRPHDGARPPRLGECDRRAGGDPQAAPRRGPRGAQAQGRAPRHQVRPGREPEGVESHGRRGPLPADTHGSLGPHPRALRRGAGLPAPPERRRSREEARRESRARPDGPAAGGDRGDPRGQADHSRAQLREAGSPRPPPGLRGVRREGRDAAAHSRGVQGGRRDRRARRRGLDVQRLVGLQVRGLRRDPVQRCPHAGARRPRVVQFGLGRARPPDERRGGEGREVRRRAPRGGAEVPDAESREAAEARQAHRLARAGQGRRLRDLVRRPARPDEPLRRDVDRGSPVLRPRRGPRGPGRARGREGRSRLEDAARGGARLVDDARRARAAALHALL